MAAKKKRSPAAGAKGASAGDAGKTGPPPGKTFVMKPPPVDSTLDLEKNLNPEQLLAVMHDKGPAIVIAGAGSGKTRVLTYRVARLVEKGIPPQNVMLVTFTKKAADEMVGRVEDLVDVPRGKLLAGTFHSVANRFLRKYAPVLGFKPNFSILDRADAEQLMKRVLGSRLDALGEAASKARYPAASTLVDVYSRAMNLHLDVKAVLKRFHSQFTDMEGEVQHLLKGYFDAKQRNNVLDFDDLLVYFLRLIRTPDIGEQVCKRVRHLLVDEYQDVNQLQADIVTEIGQHAESVMVVGDDAQAIYSFRGASIDHMFDFETCFDVPARKYYLLTNYRSTPEILALSNESIKHNTRRFEKDLAATNPPGALPEVIPCHDADEEAEYTCQCILQEHREGTSFSEQAVLFRTAFQSIVLEKALLKYKIPYIKRAGIRFYETAHVKDLLSFGFIIQNPKNELSWTRVLTLLPGMGATSASKAVEQFTSSNQPLVDFVTANLKVVLKGKRVQSTAIALMEELQKVYREIAVDPVARVPVPEERLPPPGPLFEKLLAYYEPLLKVKYKDKDPEERLLDLREFLGIASKYPTLSRLLEEIAISETFTGGAAVESMVSIQEPPLVLSTIHQAKGLEWDVVHVIGVSETLLPHELATGSPEEIEEERRLFYVAATRARNKLRLSHAATKWTYNGILVLKRSSFLNEIEKKGVFQVTTLDYGVRRFEDLI